MVTLVPVALREIASSQPLQPWEKSHFQIIMNLFVVLHEFFCAFDQLVFVPQDCISHPQLTNGFGVQQERVLLHHS